MNATVQTAVPTAPAHAGKRMLNPIVMMLAIIVAAAAMTYLVGSGEFERKGTLVVPGTRGGGRYRAVLRLGYRLSR